MAKDGRDDADTWQNATQNESDDRRQSSRTNAVVDGQGTAHTEEDDRSDRPKPVSLWHLAGSQTIQARARVGGAFRALLH